MRNLLLQSLVAGVSLNPVEKIRQTQYDSLPSQSATPQPCAGTPATAPNHLVAYALNVSRICRGADIGRRRRIQPLPRVVHARLCLLCVLVEESWRALPCHAASTSPCFKMRRNVPFPRSCNVGASRLPRGSFCASVNPSGSLLVYLFNFVFLLDIVCMILALFVWRD